MAIIDIVILFVILISLVVGIVRGFVRESLSLVTWALSLWLAFTFAPKYTYLLESFVRDKTIQIIATFLVILIFSMIILSIATYLLSSLIKSQALSSVDKSLGGLFGLIRASLILAIVILIAGFLGMTDEAWWTSSQIIDYFKPLAKVIHDLIPDNLSSYLEKTI